MSIFTDADRAYLSEVRAITKDNQGREVLVGLTEEESAFYMQYVRRPLQGDHEREDSRRHLELHDKRERARLSILGAEHELRTEKPPRH